MRSFFNFLTVASAILMVITILLQSRGSSLGGAFGGDSNVYRSKRGAEKVIFNTTTVSAVVFVLSVILNLLSRS